MTLSLLLSLNFTCIACRSDLQRRMHQRVLLALLLLISAGAELAWGQGIIILCLAWKEVCLAMYSDSHSYRFDLD